MPASRVDTFVKDHLPPRALWPDLLVEPGGPFDYPERLNAARTLLDETIEHLGGDRPLIHTDDGAISYAAFAETVDRLAHVLVDKCELVPGGRVLLRGPNTPMLAAAWFAVVKAGGVAVATMPLLRAAELTYIVEKARIDVALCDARWRDEIEETAERAPRLSCVRYWGDGDLEAEMAGKPARFDAVDTHRDDPALIAFTSGTTGKAKATVHFHRDLLAICDAFPRSVLMATGDDVFSGSPPLAFTFGLGGLLLFPMRVGASTTFVEKPSPQALLEAIERHRVSVLFTAPTAYRAMLEHLGDHDTSSLRRCVSAGETLPSPTYHAWHEATGVPLIDGIGATELLHIFISAGDDAIRPGATGLALPGYEARVVDDAGQPVPPGTIGLLAVRGPTGCRYLDDPERQKRYVRGGWNITGDAYIQDEDGYFWYQARADDMIISAGHNIAGAEVEAVLLRHDAVLECGVVGAPDPERGHIAKAYVVLRDGHAPSPALAETLQRFVKAEIAPYKYPRAVAFVDALPRTQTGKLQRYRLREQAEREHGAPSAQA